MKHGWNTLRRYLDIHDNIIRAYHKHMVNPKIYSIKEHTSQYIELYCHEILFITDRNTRVRVDITKDIEVDDSVPNRKRARTFGYRYNANIPGGKNLIRYDSPHIDRDPDKAPHHHKFHHKHDYTEISEQITIVGDDDYPHAAEFFDEVLRRF